jgi:DNA polymerase-3 subunit delta'
VAFRDIVGQERALQVLQQALASSRLAQAYLFYGPPSVGKKLTALQFTKALYCHSTHTDACDTCAACHKIATGNHPDVTLIAPAEATIKIEQVRTIQHRLSYRPYEQQRTTVIIDGCEYLTPPAANALLKTLEEPPASTLLLLLTGNKAALPLTIISRCQLVPFQPLTQSHLYTILTRQGVDPNTATLAASLAEGRLDRFDLENFAQVLDSRQSAYNVLRDIAQANGTTPFLQARQLAGKRDQCEELLRWLSLLFRDLTMLKVAPHISLYNHDLRSELTPLAHRLPLERLLEAFSLLLQLRAYLSLHSNPQLIFEQLLVQLQQVFTASLRPHRTTLVQSADPSPLRDH